MSMVDENDQVRKRKGARDSASKGSGGIRVNTACSNSRHNGSNVRNGAAPYSYVGRRRRINNRSSNFISRWIMNLRKTRYPASTGLPVVVSGMTFAGLLISAITRALSYFSSNGCIESHINGIPGNVYNWCYKHESLSDDNDSLHSKIGRDLREKTSDVKRVIFDDNHCVEHPSKQTMIAAINSHEHLSQEIVTEDQNEICYADLARFGSHMFDNHAYHQVAIGPCHYDYPLSNVPLSGSYQEAIDYFFFRESEEIRYTDKLKCLNECVDRALTERQEDAARGEQHGNFHPQHTYRQQQPHDERYLNDIKPHEKVPVDDIMLIEAARTGMTLVTEKLLLKFGLDPLYRQVHEDPSSSRNLNAVQEAIRGGYAEIVKILTDGDNTMVIDEYGRSVEDYVRMNGSPIRPIDAKNVLGIHVKEGDHKKPQEEQYVHRTKSGWNDTTADQYDKERCDFDIVDGDLDPEVFHRDYFMTGRPVVLRGQVPQIELDMFAKERWYQTKKFHPDNTFDVGPTAYPDLTDQDYCKDQMSIIELEQGKVCEEMPEKPMVHAFHPNKRDFHQLYPDFNGEILDKRGGFRSIQNFFSHVKQQSDINWQVFFGGDGSGATLHWHEAAFNILYVGVKQWKVTPPLYRGFTGMPAQDVAANLDPKISLTCVQQPGDLFYIPNYWGHSTFNHGFTIGAAGILDDWYQNGGTTFRGEEAYGEEEEEKEEGKHEGEEDIPPFLFVHINKTGGTSLITMFDERCDEEYWAEHWYDSNGGYHRPFHATAHAYIEEWGRETWDKTYTFAVVRHPLARQVSNFFFLVGNCKDEWSDFCDERLIPVLDPDSISDEEAIEAFHEWLLKVYKAFPPGSPEHYRFGAAGHGNEVYDTFGASQTSWLVDANGDMVVKDIYKLEELSKDISKLAENIPCLKNGPLELARENKTRKYPNYMLFAQDEKTKTIINEVYADDFMHFGYDAL